MPPTRTTRSSTKQPTRASTRKRAASPPPAPPAKRRAVPKHKPPANHEEAAKPKRRPRRPPPRRVDRAAVPSPRSFTARQRDLPSVNPFPAPPLRERPCWQLFGWGPDNKDGPMGTGDELPSDKQPRRSKAVEKLIEEGEFGLNGAGLVAIAAGGFFSLMVDEIGQPPCTTPIRGIVSTWWLACVLGGCGEEYKIHCGDSPFSAFLSLL